MHRLGFDEVYDTSYGADLTVVEESKEFIERFTSGQKMPLFTSCCPAWVKYCETKYPEFVPNLSTCRSPQQMFGAVVREYYKDPEKNEGKKNRIRFHYAVYGKEGGNPAAGVLYKWQAGCGLCADYNGSGKDDPQVRYSYLTGWRSRLRMYHLASDLEAGVIFGVTGGVTEAVLQAACVQGHSRVEMDKLSKSAVVRGDEGTERQ